MNTQRHLPVSPAVPPRRTRVALVQRKCACGSIGKGNECEECKKSGASIQRRRVDSSNTVDVPPIVHDVLRSSGQPLDADTRTFFEPRFGHDFSQVRVHISDRAAQSAKSINALAYTVGDDIVFGGGNYSPATDAGRELLAHELVHVAQQSQTHPATFGVSPSDSMPEKEAESFEKRVAKDPQGSTAPSFTSIPAGKVQCQFITPLAAGGGFGGLMERDRRRVEQESHEAGVSAKPAAKQEVSTKKVCLTFDDGPQKGTETVLDVLGGAISGTFFLTGSNMANNPALQKTLVERMLAEGHQIGNHTYTHDPEKEKGYKQAYGDLSDPSKLAKFQENYEKNEKHFETLLSANSPVFSLARLPGQGRFVKAGGKLIFVEATRAMGMIPVGWQFEFGPKGSFRHLKAPWQGMEEVATDPQGLPKSNNIVLFHDRHWAGKRDLFAGILDKLKDKNFQFGKLDSSGKCA